MTEVILASTPQTESKCWLKTLEKMEELCALMKLHPVTLLAACYMKKEGTSDVSHFLKYIKKELENLKLEPDEKPAVDG